MSTLPPPMCSYHANNMDWNHMDLYLQTTFIKNKFYFWQISKTATSKQDRGITSRVEADQVRCECVRTDFTLAAHVRSLAVTRPPIGLSYEARAVIRTRYVVARTDICETLT